MKSKILSFKSQKHFEHTKVCLDNLNMSYRLQTTITGIYDIEVYYNNNNDLIKIEDEYIRTLQHKIF